MKAQSSESDEKEGEVELHRWMGARGWVKGERGNLRDIMGMSDGINEQRKRRKGQ